VADTYWATLAVCGFSLAVGQAGLALCGVRRLSWLAPAVGLALLSALSWGTVRLPGHGLTALVILFAIFVAAILVLRGRSYDGAAEGALSTGLIVAVLALLAASLPFAVEGHFGILGTGFNPDMSQHLLATDRLADGHSSQLLDQGYPLGPHAIVVAVYSGGIVQGFDGLTIAVAVIASLTALAAFDSAPRPHRVAGALVVGLTYMAASYLAQGSFKETMQALFVLAFVLALREASRPELRDLPLRFVPAGLIAVGSVYAYSYPGLVWLAGAAGIWLAVELLRGRFEAASLGSAPWRALGLGLLTFAILVAPEVGRMIEFRRFETFDPDGPGLGNLFAPISPFEALGIWPSGDFRLSPGDGAVPAIGYYLGAAFSTILLLYGLFLCWRRRETAILAGLGAVLAVYAAAELVGTPYTAAKSIAIAAPVAVLVILLPLLRRPVGILFAVAAGGCSLLALANAPVGPTHYWPQLTEFRPLIADDATLVLASPKMLDEEHGERYVAWELRGGRVCIEPGTDANGLGLAGPPPPGVRFVILGGEVADEDLTRFDLPATGPFDGMRLRKIAAPYALYETRRLPRVESNCPLIAVRQARQGPG
jgi:hypothetical protein